MLKEKIIGFMGYLEWLPLWVVVIMALPILYRLHQQYRSERTMADGLVANLGFRFFYLITVAPLLFIKTLWAYAVSAGLIAWIPDMKAMMENWNPKNIGTAVASPGTTDFPWTESNLVVNWFLLFAVLVTIWIITLISVLILANVTGKTNSEASVSLSVLLLVIAVLAIGGAIASQLGVIEVKFESKTVWDLLALTIAVPLSTFGVLFLQDTEQEETEVEASM